MHCARAQAGCIVHRGEKHMCISQYVRAPPVCSPEKVGTVPYDTFDPASLQFMELTTQSRPHPSDHLEGPLRRTVAAVQPHFWRVRSSLGGLQLTLLWCLTGERSRSVIRWWPPEQVLLHLQEMPKKSADKHTRSKIKSSSTRCSTHRQTRITQGPTPLPGAPARMCTTWPPCERHTAMHTEPSVLSVFWFRLPYRTAGVPSKMPLWGASSSPTGHRPPHPGCGVPHLFTFGRSLCCKRGAPRSWLARPGEIPWRGKPNVVPDRMPSCLHLGGERQSGLGWKPPPTCFLQQGSELQPRKMARGPAAATLAVEGRWPKSIDR